MCPDRHADMNAEPWEAAVAVRLPILLTGPDTATDARIHQMEPRLALPVIDVACIAGVNAAALDDAGTVIFHDIEHLRPRTKCASCRGSERTGRTSLVRRHAHCIRWSRAGRFSEDLYYRLAGVYLDYAKPDDL